MLIPESHEYALDYEKIMAQDNFNPLVKFTLQLTRQFPYITLGEFFKRLSDGQLLEMQEIADRCAEEDEAAISDMIIITQSLSIAEGAPGESEEDHWRNLNFLCAMVTCIALNRKGFVDVYYDKLSFGKDTGDIEVVRAKPEFRDYFKSSED